MLKCKHCGEEIRESTELERRRALLDDSMWNMYIHSNGAWTCEGNQNVAEL